MTVGNLGEERTWGKERQKLKIPFIAVWMNRFFLRLMTDTDKLMDILEERNDIVDSPNSVDLYRCQGEIEFQDGPPTFVTFYPA